MAMPVEPPVTPWSFPPVESADEQGLVCVGGDLRPGTLLAAYRSGLFPMPLGGHPPIGWWSPDPRAVIPLDGLRVSRSLRRSLRRFEVRVDTSCRDVIDGCADPRRPYGWITGDVRSAYLRMHEMGWVHSVEAWSLDDGTLAGGLYGMSVGGLFAGESMFHRQTDASKAALVGLVELLSEVGTGYLLDVQWMTPHLETLGAVAIPRHRYLELLHRATALPSPAAFAG
jgi:leucyl/phenylalanyl-tRNA--protein transferase